MIPLKYFQMNIFGLCIWIVPPLCPASASKPTSNGDLCREVTADSIKWHNSPDSTHINKSALNALVDWTVEANTFQTLERSFPLLFSSILWDFQAGTKKPNPMFKDWTPREAHILMAAIRAELIKSHHTKHGECFPLRVERDRSSSKLGCSQPLHSGALNCGTWINEWVSPHRGVCAPPHHHSYWCGHVGGIYSWNVNFLIKK